LLILLTNGCPVQDYPLPFFSKPSVSAEKGIVVGAKDMEKLMNTMAGFREIIKFFRKKGNELLPFITKIALKATGGSLI
jgi:hypothetical protein